jgi:hypothetical protein
MVEPPSVQPRSAAHRAVVHLDTPMTGDFQRDAAEWAVHALTYAIQSPLALSVPDDLVSTGPKVAITSYVSQRKSSSRDVPNNKDNQAMTPHSLTTPLRTVYCPHCHLATRANSERCLNCGKHVSHQSQTCGMPPTPVPGRGPSQHGQQTRGFASSRILI